MGDVSDFAYNTPMGGVDIPGVGSTKPKRPVNYANVEHVRNRVKNEIIPLLQHVRDRRRPLTEMWRTLDRIWSMEHESQGYEGRSNVYLPAGKKGVETLTASLVGGTFPGDDNFGVTPPNEELAQQAVEVQALLKHRIENTSKVRVFAEPFYRQLTTKGNSPVKIYHRRKCVKQKRRTGQKDFGVEEKDLVLFDGPVFQPLDAANVYYWPENVTDPRDAVLVFEDLTETVNHLRDCVRKGGYLKDAVEEAVKSGTRNMDKETNDISNMAAQGITSPHDQAGKSGIVGLLVDITEVWVDFDPDAKSWDEEVNPRPFLMTVTKGGQVLRVVDNPFWHKRCPILLGRMGTKVGRVYGTGYMESIKDLQYLLNDQTNQGMDAATWSLNPIVLSDPNKTYGDVPELEPGVQILVSDVNTAFKVVTPPGDVINNTSILTAQTMSWINDFQMTPPIMSGGSAPGRAWKTATGIGTAMQNAQVPLQEVIRLCEKEVWEQMLEFFFVIDQQFSDRELMIPITQGQMMKVDPRMMPSNFIFEWLASTQTSNRQMKGSLIQQALQVITSPPVIQALQANGVKVNPAPLIRRLYTEVFGFRDVSKTLIEQSAGAIGAGPQPQPPPPDIRPLPAEQPYSGMDPTMASDEFMDMRMGADDLAALSGGANNSPDLTGEEGM